MFLIFSMVLYFLKLSKMFFVLSIVGLSILLNIIERIVQPFSKDGRSLSETWADEKSYILPGDMSRDDDSALPPSMDVTPEPHDKDISSTPSLSDGEERYECYGEGDDIDSETIVNGGHLTKPSLSSDSFRSNSSTGSLGSARSRSFNQRNTWLRSSLRRQSGSNKKLSSNALANQLFRNGPQIVSNGNGVSNSRRSSLSCDSDEMYGEQASLEEDVEDLSHKVHLLQEQVSLLSENQSTNDDRYTKVKQENAALTARIHGLEEQIRELEIRSEERLKEEEQRMKESMARQEREKNDEINHYANKAYALQQEVLELREEVIKLKTIIEKLKLEKLQLQEQLNESNSELTISNDENAKLQELTRRDREEFSNQQHASAQLLQELSSEIEVLQKQKEEAQQRARSPSYLELPSKFKDLESELGNMREVNKSLKESNEELQAQLLNNSLLEGHTLLNGVPSLAQEVETFSREQIMEALREQQEDNAKLRKYIDGILLNIVENYPQLLEVKPK